MNQAPPHAGRPARQPQRAPAREKPPGGRVECIRQIIALEEERRRLHGRLAALCQSVGELYRSTPPARTLKHAPKTDRVARLKSILAAEKERLRAGERLREIDRRLLALRAAMPKTSLRGALGSPSTRQAP